MQASLKLNTKNAQYILLTISNLESQAQSGQNQPAKMDQNLCDSNLTHSRITESMYKRELSDRVREENEHFEAGPEKECPTCSLWKRWAAEQQKQMVRLQEDLLTRELMMKSAMESLNKEIQSKSRAIQSYNRQLAAHKQQIDRLTSQLTINAQKMQVFIKQRPQTTPNSLPNLYTTPEKDQIDSHRREPETADPSTKMSQLITTEKNGRTCATAVKNNLEWSAFQTNRQKLFEELNSRSKEEPLQRYKFQNTMLKQYNSVLLQRLKESKYRKPIL